jgi:hypothetical protein
LFHVVFIFCTGKLSIVQKINRERVAEMEKEMERQKLLEIERAKTRELRHNLDMEKERQTQVITLKT